MAQVSHEPPLPNGLTLSVSSQLLGAYGKFQWRLRQNTRALSTDTTCCVFKHRLPSGKQNFRSPEDLPPGPQASLHRTVTKLQPQPSVRTEMRTVRPESLFLGKRVAETAPHAAPRPPQTSSVPRAGIQFQEQVHFCRRIRLSLHFPAFPVLQGTERLCFLPERQK